MEDTRDIRKVFCGIIYIIVVIFGCKLLDLSYKGKRVTITDRLSDNITSIRISKISEAYIESFMNKKDTISKELYIEKVYKKLIPEPEKETPIYNGNFNSNISRINASNVVLPQIGQIYAKISIPSCGIYTNVVCGLTQNLVDSYDIAMQHAVTSVYVDPMIPGYGRPILMGGHNYKSLGRLKNISIGDTITITTSYGTFYYTVTEVKNGILNVHGTTILDMETGRSLITYYGDEQLQIYTCESLDANDTHRFFVRAVRTGGTEVIF